MNKKTILFSLALATSIQAGAVAIDRAEARIVAQALVEIADTTTDDVPWAPYYIFSRGAGKGFVIVSGDDATAPIIGYTECGDYVEKQIPQPLQNMLDAWAEKVTKLQENAPQQPREAASALKAKRRLAVAAYKSSWQDVPVLMATHWNQGYPYNLLAPHRTDNNNQALTGCLATAASQIIYYFRKDNPTALLYDTPTYGYGGAPVTVSLPKGTPVRYDLMKLSGGGTAKQDSAVAVLMYAAGTSSWLTYGAGDGTATSGQTSDMGNAIRGQFNLNNDYCGKWNYSQQGWETLVYNNLASGRPMLYSGANESQGGHAVVLDGYQASTGLYHFNFGWGGQGDGYFTVDDETGMNGFNSSQAMLANITPKAQNFSARLIVPTLYERTVGTIKAMVTNDATLAQQNFYIYCTYTSNLPKSPSDEDLVTVVAPGDSALVSFSYRPMQTKPLNIFLYDDYGRLLDKATVDVLPTKAALTLNRIDVDASSESTTVNDIKFGHVNNTTANVSVTLTNGEGGSVCQPIIRCSLFSYDPEAGTWSADSTLKSISSLVFNEGETRDTVFQFTRLADGGYYKARMVRMATAGTTTPIVVDIPDSVVYFRTFAPSLAVETEGRHAKVSGKWNSALFTSSAADAYVTTYDMTEVGGINSQPVAANPNALFYASANVDGLANIIVNDKCDNLVIDANSEFLPLRPFRAARAEFCFPAFEPAKWNVSFLPFPASIPQGMQARLISEIKTTYLVEEQATEIPALTPFCYFSARPNLSSLTATDVDVAADSVVLYESLTPNMSFATVGRTLEQKALLLGEKSSQPFYLLNDAGTEVAPFSVAIESTSSANGIRLYGNITYDRNYTILADSLVSAYTVLAANTDNPAYQQFADSIAAYDLAFSTYKYETATEALAAAKALGVIIAQFLAGELADDTAISGTVAGALTDGTVRYYSIDGTPLAAPRRGLIIVRQGNKVRKMMVRN